MLGMGMSITDSSYMLIMAVVKVMDASIDLVGTFDFVACRSVHVMFTALLVGCLGISWLSLSLSACLISQYSFLSVDSERSFLLSFDTLEFISIGLVSAVKFRSCCVFRMDPTQPLSAKTLHNPSQRAREAGTIEL